MIKNKLIRVLTLAAGLLAGSTAFAADGDIYEIRPCTAEGTARGAYATIADPLTSGESVIFKVRLIQRTAGNDDTVWKLEHVGATSEIVDDALFPLQIGVYVSGQLRYASLIDHSASTESGFTDLVFEYKTRPGDFALPIVLAATNGGDIVPAGETDQSFAYVLNRTDKWTITNDAGNTCRFWFWTANRPVTPPDGDRSQDYSLSQSGAYVQTIDFDSTWEEDGTLWRSVHQNSTITVGATPSLTAIAAPEDAVTLYVWSMDENAVRIRGGETVNLQMSSDETDTLATQVATVTFAGGQLTADFQIEGVTEGESCNLVLSPWKNYRYIAGTNDRIVDYITVPVKCIEPMPPTAIVEADRTVAYANGDYMMYGALLNVYLSQPYEDGDVAIRIDTSFADAATVAWGDYVRFSTTQDEVTVLPDADAPVVTIPAGSTAKQQVYVFCLRGDTHTTGSSRIVFTPVVTDATAAATIQNVTAAGMEIRAEEPVITTPSEGAVIEGIAGDDIEFTVAVSDTYADTSDDATGYKIFIKYRAADAFRQLDGVYYVGEGNVLYKLTDDGAGGYNKSNDLPILNYPASGDGLTSQVYVVSPVSGKKSETRNFTANIKEARTSNVVETSDTDIFYEGDQATFKISISEKNDTGATIYAFLKASDNCEAGMFSGTPLFVVCDDTDLTRTRGLAINNYQDSTSASKIKFLDGLSEDAGGLSVTFEVVLCTTRTYSEATRIAGYDSNYLNVTVFNQEPTITRIEMNGFESEANGYTFPNKVPKGMTQSFLAVVKDAGAYDVKNTAEPFQCKWTATLEGVGAIKTETLTGDPADNPFVYDFPRAGNWTIRLQVKDKDMEDWSAETYSVNISVLDNPQVLVTAPTVLAENDRTGSIQVQLSYWDTMYTDRLRVKLTVDEYSAGRANPGYLKLDSAYASTVAGEDNVYYLDIADALPVDLLVESMDGTDSSSIYGFTIKAEVVTTDTLPTSNTAANEYYLSDQARILVENANPICNVTPEQNETTNRWEVAGGVASSYPIRWQVRSDVDADFAGIDTFQGIKVSVTGCQNDFEQFVTESATGTFYPDFGDAQGDRDVRLTIEDKDGGVETWVWHFTVTPSKFLTTISSGPSGGTTSSTYSRKYQLLGERKLGKGHTWVENATFSSASSFRLRWNCSKDATKRVYAYGYKVATPNDNGSLDGGQDIALDASGSAQAGVTLGSYYHYPEADADEDDQKDSFFYCWILHQISNEGEMTSEILGNTILPERPGVVGVGTVVLPTAMTEDNNYMDTEAEAVFAKEWKPTDNLGDINQDGVPDVFAHTDWAGGNLIKLAAGNEDDETLITSDLLDLAQTNPDEDKLPGILKQSVNGALSLTDEGGQSYAPIGLDFITRWEIRGLHEGLNATDLTKSDVDFSEDEQKAYTATTGKDYDPTTVNLGEWSPEPGSATFTRLDPTMEDTDGDSFPDGWEYFFWYQAHVWAPAEADIGKPRGGQRYVFERFNMDSMLVGDEIPASEVEARFNPCVELTPAQYADLADFDNDGLSDLEELILGTNPCHWDTDGDHMGDCWEVMMGLDPLNGADKGGNPDGDYMAYVHTIGLPVRVIGDDATSADSVLQVIPTLVAGVDYLAAGDTAVMLRTVKAMGYTFQPKMDPTDDTQNLTYGLTTDRLQQNPQSVGWGFNMVDNIQRVELTFEEGDELNVATEFVLIHDQVREAYEFDPRTGWYVDSAGYLGARWSAAPDAAGRAVNTRAYSTYDEFLVMKYRRDYQLMHYSLPSPGDSFGLLPGEDMWGYIRRRTTIPTVILDEESDTEEETESNDETTSETSDSATRAAISKAVNEAFAAAGSSRAVVKAHGADTDGDGVPDGWELYMFRCPNAAPTADEDGLGDANANDFDGDGLNWAQEFAGTDSCAAYSSCESIYKNHPGKASGWWNKFFPTNPGTIWEGGTRNLMGDAAGADTDGDGVSDGAEGGTWTSDFYNGGNVYHLVEFTAVYGNPQDDGSCCVRGGGMNPCAVDTDLDGLPDGWEMQHAGVKAEVATGAVRTTSEDPLTANLQLSVATLIADGLYGNGTNTVTTVVDEDGNATAHIYLAGGMDPTWSGDTVSDGYPEGQSYDARLGRNRDVDFDHDGLQNYQEYLVQSMRHFRWDDITTPLMGRLLTGGATGYTQKFYGFAPFDSSAQENLSNWPMRPENYIATLREAWADGAAAIDAVLERTDAEFGQQPWTVEGWRALGYFTPPPKAFDRSNFNFPAPLYMFPISGSMLAGAAGYVSTDPRMADTDGDAMDDYYELFHGLNPILGTDPTTAAESAWVGGKKGDIISAVQQLMVSPIDNRTTYNAFYNPWIYPTYSVLLGQFGQAPTSYASLTGPAAYDPVLYPWVMGTPLADADGDGIRNSDESLKANITDPSTLHTDPTPAWFTDRTQPASYTAQYYVLPGTMYLTGFPWLAAAYDASTTTALTGGASTYAFTFEENEGYDTDGDWVPDGREAMSAGKASSDPLRFDDPNRRQALWLNGVDAFVMSAEQQIRPSESYDLFRQFTVECWVRPEKTGSDQTILERSCLYPADNINNDNGAIRANFRIGLSADGRIYGMFDNSDSVESGLNQPVSCQRVDGIELPLNKWAHVALTFDGEKLALYLNGAHIRTETTKLIPANGVTILRQDPSSTNKLWNFEYDSVPSSLFIGARPQKQAVNALAYVTEKPTAASFSDFREFFQGYVDEVRLWDGARTAQEIEDNYTKRFTLEDVQENHDEVYASWRPDITSGNLNADPSATRNANDNKGTLPTELINHYNFSTLPGAVKAEDVIKAPIGFTQKVLDAAMSDYATNEDIATEGLYVDSDMTLKGGDALGTVKGDLTVGWWNDCTIHSTVYDDYHVVPWIQNTVAHLPMVDGSCVDSFLYGENVSGGYLTAQMAGLSKYTFPNTAVPYARVAYGQDRYMRLLQAEQMYAATGDTSALDQYERYRFHVRTKFLGTSDLLPMGGAFAKTCDMMWDGAAGEAWEFTQTDDDGDGLPDWWEEYARNNYCSNLDPSEPLNWDTAVTYRGATMPAWQAYTIDRAKGMQPDGTIDPTYAATLDANENGIPDWWEEMYDLSAADPLADTDGDGLSNYAEYYISEVLEWAQLDPTQRASNGVLTDYFRNDNAELGSYYGAIFTDHDFVENVWEKTQKRGYADANVYDPLDDNDEDGWSNYAEARASFWKAQVDGDLIDRWTDDLETHVASYPEPALGLRVTYNGIRDVTSSRLVVLATSKGASRPDAKFIVSADADGETKYIGSFGIDTTMHGFLNPGFVSATTVFFEYATLTTVDSVRWNWDWYRERDTWPIYTYDTTGSFADYRYWKSLYPHIELEEGELDWNVFAQAVATDGSGRAANLQFVDGDPVLVGTLDCRSGEWTLNTTRLATASTNDLTKCVMRVTYSSRIGAEWPQTIYLSDTEEFGDGSDEQKGYGHLCEGKNQVVAFFDLDADGEYTPGEPFGVVNDVDVGWHKTAETPIELRDTTGVVPRFDISALTSDRTVVKGEFSSVTLASSGNSDEEDGDSSENTEVSGLTKTVRIVRESINGIAAPNRIMMSKDLVLDARTFIHEGDVLAGERYDLDWQWLVRDAADLGIDNISTVSYRIEEVGQTIAGLPTNIVRAIFVNNYQNKRGVATAASPIDGAPVRSSAPTFTWTTQDESATAFKLQVADAEGAIVYDSGIQLLPGRTADAYAFTPGISVGAPIVTNGAPVFVDGTNYSWRVALLNAKFNTAEDNDESAWNDWTDFRTAVNEGTRAAGYGKCAVAVRYYGPATNDTASIIVEAFDRADFSGQPLARVRLSSDEQLNDQTDTVTTNACLTGVVPGEIYVRAFIDGNNNGTREPWESWGYVNNIDRDKLATYQPVSLTVIDSMVACPTATLYIEDTDVNKNEIADCLEEELFTQKASADPDSDGDGLTDAEESDYNTDAGVWDTDGDGMPDGWEVLYAETDPLYADAALTTEGDVMAYAEITGTLVTFDDSTTYLLAPGQKVPVAGDDPADYAFTSYYMYGDLTGRGTNVTVDASVGLVKSVAETTVALVHAQVYDAYGFDHRTAVDRADAVNTKAFTALDKYLVVRYLEALGLANETAMNTDKTWADYTLKPGVVDADYDGVADGWELYVMFGKTDGEMLDGGLAAADEAISPWVRADARATSPSGELKVLEEFDGGSHPTDPWVADTDGDGITDDLAYKYHLKGDQALADNDNDGLSNYAEYLLSEVFDLGETFDPDNAHSLNENDIDYFFPIGSLYAGALFSDHDFMEDAWEDKYGLDYVSRYAWDAASDKDEDGWSAFAECRYNNFVSSINADKTSHMLGEAEMRDYPVPLLKLTLRYNQSQVLSESTENASSDSSENQDENTLAPIIIKTYTTKSAQSDNVVPDATFTVQPGQTTDRIHYLGMYGDRVVHGALTPGYITPGSFNLQMAHLPQNDSYSWIIDDEEYKVGTYAEYMSDYTEYGYAHVKLQTEDFEWSDFVDGSIVTVSQDGDSSMGYIRLAGERIGTIDTQTGEFSLDLGPIGRYSTSSTNAVYSLSEAVFRVTYTSKVPVLQSKKFDLFLGVPNKGAVLEGQNRIVAFYDMDGDGEYTPGEPLGFVEDIDVGWKQGAAEIELTDTSPVITRMKLELEESSTDTEDSETSVSSDRYVLYGTEHGDVFAENVGSLSGGDYQRFRLVRTLINGVEATSQQVVVDKWIHLKQRPYIFEGDVLSDTEFDLDWSGFQQAVPSTLDATSVVYRVVLGNGAVDATSTNNLFSVATTRHFDPNALRARPTLVSPGVGGDSIIYGARPTFKWTMNGYNSYTAFRLQVLNEGSTSIVWDSGVRLAPACDSNGNYTFSPDVYLGDHLQSGVKYTWRVSMYNAKFQSNYWSTNTQTFMMNGDVIGLGSIPVCVRYFGPSLSTGTIRVEAFETPDFTGSPVARASVTDTSTVASFGEEHTANATLMGLPEGTYYIRAYLDANSLGTRFVKDAWESWGYACPRETSAQMFTPSAVTVSFDTGKASVVPVYIEDADLNGNNLPDAWESSRNNGELYAGAGNVSDVKAGGISVNTTLATLAERANAAVSPGPAAQLYATLANESVQALVFGIELPKNGSVAATVTEATQVVEGSVAITAATFDPETKKVTLDVTADVENAYANTLAAALYTFNATTADVTCTVWRKATLAEAGWTKVASKEITVGSEASSIVVDLGDVDITTSGFFKVTLEK